MRPNSIDHQPGHVIDFLPTCMEAGAAQYPASMPKPEGVSLLAAIRGKKVNRAAPIFWEHEGNRAIRIGKWKAVAVEPTGSWELYDIDADRTELHDVAAKHPEKVKEMVRQWEAWARRTQAIPWMWTPQYSAGS